MGIGALRRHTRWGGEPIPEPLPGLVSREELTRAVRELCEQHDAEVAALRKQLERAQDEILRLTPIDGESLTADAAKVKPLSRQQQNREQAAAERARSGAFERSASRLADPDDHRYNEGGAAVHDPRAEQSGDKPDKRDEGDDEQGDEGQSDKPTEPTEPNQPYDPNVDPKPGEMTPRTVPVNAPEPKPEDRAVPPEPPKKKHRW